MFGKLKNGYEVYVGESNDIFTRTKQHYGEMSKEGCWQSKLKDNNPILYVIGHAHFNKSLTLDVENRLRHYLLSVESVQKVHNGRGNEQKNYYTSDEFDKIFSKIWRKLNTLNKELFPPESYVRNSELFKASPLHKLTEDQLEGKEKIIEKVIEALQNKKRGQLIFVEGGFGTGKTVLNSSTFYDIYCRYEEEQNSKYKSFETNNLKVSLIVNHKEQITIYSQIASKLGISNKYGKVVYKSTPFINAHSKDEPIDVAFIDEGNLLLTQGKQSYRGKNQLEDIINRAKVTVVMFSKKQILNAEQYWEDELIEKYRNEAKKNNNYIKLEKQLRIKSSDEYMAWLNEFVDNGIINKIPKKLGGYDIKVFDTPEELDKEIKVKAKNKDTKLSRLIATYDWPYNSEEKNKFSKYWEVKIDKWHKPWNNELQRYFNKEEKNKIKNLSWAEQPKTKGEVGSTFSIHGLDLNYAGVILGPSVKYRNGRIVFDPSKSCNGKATRNRTLSDGTMQNFAETFIKNEVGVLMSRGINGLYIYACDDELRGKLKECIKR